jgi:putative hemolysin
MGILNAFSLAGHNRFPELTYASPEDPKLKRWLIAQMEQVFGRNYFAELYGVWQQMFAASPDKAMSNMLALLNIELNVKTGHLPKSLPHNTPLVMIANHPFGIGDGVAILSMAEQMGRPFRILINNELLKIPEIRPYSLPISFKETREALRLNLQTRQEAMNLLRQGVTIIVFPSGGVATATKGFGKADDLPWKRFPARLIQSANAAVLPVYFEGQCSRLFHLASGLSMTLRTGLLIREFRCLMGKTINAHIGEIIDADKLAEFGCRDELTRILHSKVFSLPPPTHSLEFNQNRPL